jgi:hypothetical protein
MPSAFNALTAGLEATERNIGIGDEVGEDAERVGATTDAGGNRVRQPAETVKELGSRFGADHPLELTNQQRERMWAGNRANQVVSAINRGDPVAHRVVHGVFQSLRPRLHSYYLGAQQAHARDVECLSLGVDLPHVDGAVESEQRGRSCGRDPVLTRSGFRDHPRLAHAPRQQRLAEHIVDLV